MRCVEGDAWEAHPDDEGEPIADTWNEENQATKSHAGRGGKVYGDDDSRHVNNAISARRSRVLSYIRLVGRGDVRVHQALSLMRLARNKGAKRRAAETI